MNERNRKPKRRETKSFCSCVFVCFDSKKKTNQFDWFSFVCSSFNCFRSALFLSLSVFLLAISCAQRVLNFNKYVHFDSYASTRIVCSFVSFAFLSFFHVFHSLFPCALSPSLSLSCRNNRIKLVLSALCTGIKKQ